MPELCITCQKREPHGYVNSTGEYLEYTCLPCHRRNSKRDNYIEGGDAKVRSRTPVPHIKETCYNGS